MGLRTKAILLGVFSYLASPLCLALGLGEIKVTSLLNQPLEAEIQLLQVRELTAQEILVGLGTPEDFSRVGIDRPFLLNDLKFAVDMTGPNGPVIHVSSTRSIVEPFLNFIIQTHWPSGKLLREYTVLLDLPVFSNAPVRAVQAARSQSPVQQRQARPDTSARVAEDSAMDGNTYGPVSSSDTLWSIAAQSRSGNDVSMQQTMLAIQRLNPDAFINGNMNLLKKGAVLRLPDEQDVSKFDPVTTNRDAASAPEAQIDAGRSSVERTAAASQVKGRVKLSTATDMTGSKSGSGSGDGEQDVDAVRTQLLSTQEELASTQRENADLKGRVATMDEQIQTMEKLLEVSNTNLRKLEIAIAEQQKLEGESTEGALAETSSAVIDDSAAEGAESVTGGDASAASETPETTVAVEKPKETAVDKPVVTPPAAKAKPSLLDILMANALYIGGALLLLIAGVAYFVLARRKNDEDDGFEYEEFVTDAEDPIAQASGIAIAIPEADLDAPADLYSAKDDDVTLESLGSMLLADTPTSVVTMNQVDDLIAQAEYRQALISLNDVDAEPADIQLKRLEVFAKQNNLEAFDAELNVCDFDVDSAALAQAEALRNSIYGTDTEGVEEDFDELDTTLRFEAITEADIEAAALEEAPEDDIPSKTIDSELDALALDNIDDLSLDNFDATLDLDDTDEKLELELDDDLSLDLGSDLDIDAAEDEISAADALTLDIDIDDKIRASEIEEDSDELDLSNLSDASSTASAELSLVDEADGFNLDLESDLLLDEGLDEDDSEDSEEFSAELSLDSDDESLEGFDLSSSDSLSLDDVELDEAFTIDTEESLADNAEPLVFETETSTETDTAKALSEEGDTDFDSLDASDVDLESLDHELDELASDFNGDFGHLDGDVIEVDDAAEDLASLELMSEVDLDETDLDEAEISVTPEALVEKTALASNGVPDFDSDDDSEPGFLGDSDEVATKIDLLRVFVDMGDTESALNTLEEIREEGNGAQKAEAEALFAELS
ncbi:MAG: FimV/HubP family polar landmark protein [Marinagarivorans sp.]|nr:FimV/HubP family polar landmark protein [Marinagarivorans sp.]